MWNSGETTLWFQVQGPRNHQGWAAGPMGHKLNCQNSICLKDQVHLALSWENMKQKHPEPSQPWLSGSSLPISLPVPAGLSTLPAGRFERRNTVWNVESLGLSGAQCEGVCALFYRLDGQKLTMFIYIIYIIDFTVKCSPFCMPDVEVYFSRPRFGACHACRQLRALQRLCNDTPSG